MLPFIPGRPLPPRPGMLPGGMVNAPPPSAIRIPPGVPPSSVIGGPTPPPMMNPLAGSMVPPPPMGGMPMVPSGLGSGALAGGPPMPGGPGMPGMPPMGGAMGPMPPSPPPPPPAPTIMQLMQQADQQALIEQLIDQLMGQQKEGPVYAPWYRRPKKPDTTSIIGWADADKQAWKQRNDEILDDLRVMYNTLPDRFREDWEHWWYEPYISPELLYDSEGAVDIIAGQPRILSVPYTDPSQQDEAQDHEDFGYWFDGERDARFVQSGNGSRKRAKAWYAVNMGWTAERLVPNLIDPTFPFDYALLNPMTVYPTWDGNRGLLRVIRVYRQTIAGVMGDYGSQDNVRDKLLGIGRKYGGGDEREALTQVVEVTEYWDTWYRAVLVDGETVVPVTAHQMGRVPYRVIPCGKGAPVSLAESAMFDTGSEWRPFGTSRSDPMQRYQSTSLIRPHKGRFKQQQRILGKQMTAIRHADNPAMTYTKGSFADEGMPDMSSEPGTVNEVSAGASLAPFNPMIQPEVIAPVMAMMGRDAQAGGLGNAAQGSITQSNVTGVAVDMASEAGMKKLLPFAEGIDWGDAGILEDATRIVRDWGHLIGSNGQRGTGLVVPRRNPAGSRTPAIRLTPQRVRDLFGEGDPRFTVRSVGLSMQQKVQILNAANMAKSAGVTSMEYWAAELGIQSWPDEQRRMMQEKAVTMPEVEKIRMYKDLMESDDLRWLAPIFARYALEKPSENDPQLANPDGSPGGGQGAPSPQGGMSLPMMGIPAGQGGGRPALPPGLGLPGM